MPDTFKLVLNTKYELGLTPRFSGFKEFAISPSDTSHSYNTSWYRLQLGLEIMKSQYVHLFTDYFRVRTNLGVYEQKINAIGFGIQYSLKFEKALVELPPIRLYKKPINIRWYPELSAGSGAINLLNDSYRISGLRQSATFNAFVFYGMGWNFYVNKWGQISLLYFQEYYPYLKQDPYRYGPLQIKLVFKL